MGKEEPVIGLAAPGFLETAAAEECVEDCEEEIKRPSSPWQNRDSGATNGRLGDLTVAKLKWGDKTIQLGAFCATKTYVNFIKPVVMYVLREFMIENGATFFTNSKNFAAAPTQDVIKIAPNQNDTVFSEFFAFYHGQPLLTYINEMGHLVINFYAQDGEGGAKFFDELEQKLTECNFYKGACLEITGHCGAEIQFVKTPSTKWDDCILSEEKLEDIEMNTHFFLKESDKLSELGIKKRGVLLYGPPGTGKTTLVRGLFNRLEGTGVTRVYVTNEAFLHIDVANLFDMIKYLLPAVLVFEDLDLVAGNRENGGTRMIGSLLTHLDGISKIEKPLVIIGTTNDIDMVDHALKQRPKRFDRRIEIAFPDREETEQLYIKFADGLKISDELLDESEGFTGSHVEETVHTAKLLAQKADNGKRFPDFLVRAAKHIRKNFGLAAGGQMGFKRGHKEGSDVQQEMSEDPGEKGFTPRARRRREEEHIPNQHNAP